MDRFKSIREESLEVLLQEGVFEIYLERFLKELRRIVNTPKFRKFLYKLHQWTLQKDGVEFKGRVLVEGIRDVEGSVSLDVLEGHIQSLLGISNTLGEHLNKDFQEILEDISFLKDLKKLEVRKKGYSINECLSFLNRYMVIREVFLDSEVCRFKKEVCLLLDTDISILKECQKRFHQDIEEILLEISGVIRKSDRVLSDGLGSLVLLLLEGKSMERDILFRLHGLKENNRKYVSVLRGRGSSGILREQMNDDVLLEGGVNFKIIKQMYKEAGISDEDYKKLKQADYSTASYTFMELMLEWVCNKDKSFNYTDSGFLKKLKGEFERFLTGLPEAVKKVPGFNKYKTSYKNLDFRTYADFVLFLDNMQEREGHSLAGQLRFLGVFEESERRKYYYYFSDNYNAARDLLQKSGVYCIKNESNWDSYGGRFIFITRGDSLLSVITFKHSGADPFTFWGPNNSQIPVSDIKSGSYEFKGVEFARKLYKEDLKSSSVETLINRGNFRDLKEKFNMSIVVSEKDYRAILGAKDKAVRVAYLEGILSYFKEKGKDAIVPESLDKSLYSSSSTVYSSLYSMLGFSHPIKEVRKGEVGKSTLGLLDVLRTTVGDYSPSQEPLFKANSVSEEEFFKFISKIK